MTASNIVELVPEPKAPAIERPCYRVYDHPVTVDGKKLRAGVYHHTSKAGDDDKSIDVWLCGPLRVEAVTHSESEGDEFGRLLRFCNLAGRWIEWAMPGELLAGKPEPVIAALMGMGLDVGYGQRASVCQYIAAQRPKGRMIAATSTGWHSPELFIMPNRNIGQGQAVYQTEAANTDDYRQGGTLDGWRDSIGRLCEGNPVLTLAVCTGLVGPLLYHVQRQGLGFHLIGDSSTGKSSAMAAAASVWGRGSDFMRTWRATGNGLEGIASQRNDTLLVLDEIGEADPKHIGAIVYLLGNGTGKARANRYGAARAAKRWRVPLLSSGEQGLSSLMAEGGSRTRAGQEVRLLGIPVRRPYGAWDTLHGMAGGREFSDALQQASSEHYGHAGPLFVERLLELEQPLTSLPELLASMREQYDTTGGQEDRAAERFALLAMAGELAIEFGILPVPEGEAIKAMLELFSVWRAGRGTGPSEDRHILQSITDFIDRHGGSRFQSAVSGSDSVRDRAGLWDVSADGSRLYLFNSTGLQEAVPGYDLNRIVLALDSAGAIAKKEAGKNQAQKRLPEGGKSRFFWIDPECLFLEV